MHAHVASSLVESLGQGLVRSLVAKDAGAMKSLMAPGVRFRAVTPGRCWESTDADTVVDDIVLGTWFSAERRITGLLAVESERIGAPERAGTVERLRYRLAVERPDGRFVVEQQSYIAGEAGRISSIGIVCSGYLPA